MKLLSIGLRSPEHEVFARDLGVLGAVALAEQAVETVTIFGSTGFTEPGGAMNLQLGAGLVWAWLRALAVWGGVRVRAQNPAA